MNVAAKAVELGYCHVAPLFPRRSQRGLELGPAIHRVRALAAFDLNELSGDLETLCLGELIEGLPLRFNPEPGPSLL
jgi:hypothetical protein